MAEKVGQLPVEKSHGGWQSAQPAPHVFPNPYKKLPFGSFFGGEGGTIANGKVTWRVAKCATRPTSPCISEPIQKTVFRQLFWRRRWDICRWKSYRRVAKSATRPTSPCISEPIQKLPFGSFFGGEGGTIVPSGGSNP